MSYKKVEVGSLVTLRQGFAINKKTLHHISESPTSLHLLRIGDMKSGIFSVYVKDTIPERFIAKEDDVIYTRTGQVGLVFRRQHGVIHNNCFSVTTNDNEKLRQSFLYYVLQEKSFFEEANSRATGAAQSDLPHDAFNSIRIPLPSVEKQDIITTILDQYNNLIENNEKQIKLLEEAAQRLYKEWFVDLRFPGYETTPIVDGVPEGWQRVSIGDLISYEIGGGWGEEEPTPKSETGAYVIRGTDLYGITHGELLSIPYRYHSKSNLSSRILLDGDIVFEVSGGSRTEGVARTALIRAEMLERWEKPVMCASFCKLVRPSSPNLSQYIFDCFQYLRESGKTEKYDKRSASSIVNYRWKDFLLQEQLLKPSEDVIEKYNCVANYYSKIINCSLQIDSAKRSRDRLLPKLMTGEIEV